MGQRAKLSCLLLMMLLLLLLLLLLPRTAGQAMRSWMTKLRYRKLLVRGQRARLHWRPW